jgi:hypothetical protein
MRDRIITIVALLFIGACALVVFIRISSHYSAPDYQTPAVWTPSPVTDSRYSSIAAAPASPVPTRPRRTVTTWVTVTASDGG